MQVMEPPATPPRCPTCGAPGGRLSVEQYEWYPAVSRVECLSVREREVLLLLAAGLSNRHIARRLELTERTVKAHLAQIMNKLGVDSRLRAGLVAYAYQQRHAAPAPAPAMA